ncbi:lasso peptide biosynthesis B2 protein [Sphingobium yanoikuyae]|uniref:lasso peptide biosynthesis B2 protein n=1 Tax=Sphingobium yanoikuyae TaxID=13690 RepID=UPI001377CBA0|nr:lasso peptide biosynthesis B2 protein [Sphingobium yanoikuyae]NBB39627.1 lasso peptide biosynthesis B2 protein [Sphingobium yanoikuyae]
MAIGLKPNISFCDVEGQLVFLDTKADRYFGLSRAAERGFRDFLAAPASPDPASPHMALIGDAQLLEMDAPAAPIACPARTSGRESLLDRLEASNHGSSAAATISASLNILSMRAQLRLRRLSRILARLGTSKNAVRDWRHAPDEAMAIIAAFAASARTLRSHDQCLPRSLALAHALIRSGLKADLFLAVRLRPFAAHCWVEHDGLIANDRAAHVDSYQPILIL